MFKFLFYVFLFYVIFRFIFGVLFKGGVHTRVTHFNTHNPHQGTPAEEEGRIRVKSPTGKKPKADDGNLGEYVDYEEVK